MNGFRERVAALLVVAVAAVGCSSKDNGGELPPAQPAAGSGGSMSALGVQSGAGLGGAGGQISGSAGMAVAGMTGAGSGGMAGSPMTQDGGTMTQDGAMPDDGGAMPPPPFEGEGDPWLEPAPRATCGAGDMPETGQQGIDANVRCNLVVHGKVPAPHFLSHAWFEHCSYVNGQTGTTVIDVSDSAHPKMTATLTTTGMQSNWETMKVNENSGLLAGYQSNGPVLDVYDVSEDCAHPVLKTSYELGGSGHAGQFSPDGTIYYASSMYTAEVFAVDLTAPASPKVITSSFGGKSAHDLFIGKNGDRGYFAASNLTGGLGVGMVAIIDTSAVQARANGAMGRVIHEWSWPDGNISQYPIAISYRGRDYLMITDELGSGACGNPEKPPYGYARIFDIEEETKPVLVSKIKTEAVGPCTGTPVGDGFFGVGTHYCNVDRLDDPRLLACGFWAGGVRVFDIRNPWRPKELAYFDTLGEGVPGLPRIRVEERELWVATMPGTFYVLKFADGLLDPIVQD
jgi:hypothetical protein